MKTITKPSKEEVRTWMMRRVASHEPLPDREAIRRQLGWKLITPPGGTLRH